MKRQIKQDLYGILPAERSKPYESVTLVEQLLDNGDLKQYKKDFGKTILCGFGRINGWAVGVVANNRQIVKNKKGKCSLEVSSIVDSADKAAGLL